MGAKFSEEEKATLRIQMIQQGFRALKKGGISAVNIDEITGKCYVSKGTFYNLFESKTEFLYQVMIYKRQESKNKMLDHLDSHGKLSWDGLYAYLHWLADENPNIFSYLDGQHSDKHGNGADDIRQVVGQQRGKIDNDSAKGESKGHPAIAGDACRLRPVRRCGDEIPGHQPDAM